MAVAERQDTQSLFQAAMISESLRFTKDLLTESLSKPLVKKIKDWRQKLKNLQKDEGIIQENTIAMVEHLPVTSARIFQHTQEDGELLLEFKDWLLRYYTVDDSDTFSKSSITDNPLKRKAIEMESSDNV